MRLNKSQKQTIRSRLMSNAFAEEGKQLEEEKLKWGDAFYDELYPPKVQKAMEALGEGAFLLDTRLRYAGPGGDYGWCRWHGEGRRVFYRHTQGAAISFSGQEPLYLARKALDRKQDEYTKRRSKALQDIDAVLESVSTDKQLRETWPEAVDVIDEVLGQSPNKAYLPATLLAELNQTLGLTEVK